ncbi:MAG: hypothetical protein IK104_02315 [Clostridia bacterium]|nr:hypothetical protein [Clostridia bacterium]
MKRRKTTEAEPAPESISQWRRRFALDRRREDREKGKTAALQRKQETFRRKVREADDKKAPVTTRTKGYYPFLREYPENADETGCREINVKKKRTALKVIALVLLAVIAFSAGYILTRGSLLNSREPVEIPGREETEAPAEVSVWRHVSADLLADGDPDAIAAFLDEAGATTAVFPFKDENGYVYFDVGEYHGMSADRLLPYAWDVVERVQEKGYKTAAYICCFQDTVCAWSEPYIAVNRAASEDGAVWSDNAGKSWLNPYSEGARSYLLRLVEKAGEAGFDYIVLDQVAFPTDVGVSQPTYPGEADFTGTRNALLRSFVADAVARAGTAKTALAVKTAGLAPDAPDNAPPYYGHMLGSAAGTLLADARVSVQPKNVTVGNETFLSPDSLPFVFVLAVGDELKSGLERAGAANRPALWVDAGKDLSEALDAARLSGVGTAVVR